MVYEIDGEAKRKAIERGKAKGTLKDNSAKFTDTTENLARLRARIIAGGANNPLANPEAGRAIWEKGLIYAPDFVINGGGIINVAGEIRALAAGTAFDQAWVEGKLSRHMRAAAPASMVLQAGRSAQAAALDPISAGH